MILKIYQFIIGTVQGTDYESDFTAIFSDLSFSDNFF